ncbi:hypothetical protein JW752_03850 [Candidatus Peregrinibacteria bacterium]|nr:hypothetical protein [Candidatus Peregrinibacteria bacterium]
MTPNFNRKKEVAMKWHTTLAALAAILFLGISIPVHAEGLSFEKAPKANDLIQKAAKCPGGDCGDDCRLAQWLNANVADQKVFARSDCNGYLGTDLLDKCKQAVAAIPEKFKCKRGGKKPPHVADTGNGKKPGKKPADKPADNGKVDKPDPPAAASTECLDKEKFETFKHALWDRVATRKDVESHTASINKLKQSIDELKARPDAPRRLIIFLLILNLLLTLYTAWPWLGPTLKKLISPPPKDKKK